jgi:antitoxin component YwqK of YwqJK toxin-antitoxin module
MRLAARMARCLSVVFLLLLLPACPGFGQVQDQPKIPERPNAKDGQGRPTGEWVMLFDANWEQVEDLESAEFYRLVTFQAGKPKGIVKDFYVTGAQQWQGFLSDMNPDVPADGKATWYFANGKKQEEGSFKGEARQGAWAGWYQDGTRQYEGSYARDLRDGKWTWYYANGQLMSSAVYKNGSVWTAIAACDSLGKTLDPGTLKNGSGIQILYNRNGTISRRSELRDGKSHGRVIVYDEKGKKTEEGSYENGVPEGRWNLYGSENQTGGGDYVGGRKNGYWTEFPDSGFTVAKMEGNYRDGLEDGTWRYWYSNGGKRAEGSYRLGKRVGRWEELSRTGTPGGGEYVDGVKTGEWTEWDFDFLFWLMRALEAMRGGGAALESPESKAHGSYDEEGEKNGLWTVHYATGDRKEEGNYEHGLRVGRWQVWSSAGEQGGGKYQRDKKTGPWVEFDLFNDKYEGEYSAGNHVGTWMESWYVSETGAYRKHSEGFYRRDVQVGQWKQWGPDGEEGGGQYVEGRKEGRWIEWSRGYDKSEGEYRNGRKEGVWTSYSYDEESGRYAKEEEGAYRNDERDGTWSMIGNDGESLGGSYRAGKQVGPWKERNGDGYAEGTYRDGNKEGVWTFYYGAGRMSEQGSYSNDKRVGQWRDWSPDPRAIPGGGSYVDGARDGQWTEYDTDSTRETGRYLRGSREGLWKMFSKTGSLTVEGEFKEGKKHGAWKQHFDDGGYIQMQFADGRRQPRVSLYGPDGNLKGTGDIDEEKGRTGLWREYGPNRAYAEGMYVNNREEGEWKRYSAAGVYEDSIYFCHGSQVTYLEYQRRKCN